MRQEFVALDLPGEAVDIDVGPWGAWLALCRRNRELVVASAAASFDAPGELRYPLVRWLGAGEILIVDRRTSKRRDNAYVLSPSGSLKAQFFVGDGIQDVLVMDERIAITYFDEGVYGGEQPSEQGLCVFASGGTLEFGYQSDVPDPVDIADCYCACAAGPHEICFSSYEDFPLVRLNLKTRQQEVHGLPDALSGASALATDGVRFWFHSPYDAKGSVLEWQPGKLPIEIGTYEGRLRAFGSGFLSTGVSGYTVLQPGTR